MTQELYLAEIIEKSIGTYSNALTKSLSRHIARDILKHFIIKRMNTNEELKTRPDFEKLAKQFSLLYWNTDKTTTEAAKEYLAEFWTTHVEPLQAENDKLQKFKEYVHDRLDKMGVPSDPEPANNASHGCRIEGRLNFVQSENQKLREALKELYDDEEYMHKHVSKDHISAKFRRSIRSVFRGF